MQYKCEKCEDTGSLSKHLAGNLDCASCSAATDRVELEKWLNKNTAISDQDSAWLIHQRALAMAPKQEAPKGTLPKWVDDQKGKDPGMDDLIEHMEMIYANYIALAALAAPAVANGALTDEQIMYAYDAQIAKGGSADSIIVRTCRAILAAAGPDAALVQALESALAIINNEADPDEYAAPLKSIRAALSGAKGIIGMCKCKFCKGEGWVCENHADKPWASEAGGCKCGAGAPCACNTNADLPDGFTVIASAKGN